MERMDIRKAVPPAPLMALYIQPGEIGSDGKPMEAGAERHEFGWPGFGYEGYCADRSINTDSTEAMLWCIDMGIVNRDSKTLYNTPLRSFAEKIGKKKVAALLKKLGWPE